jgi:dTDP-4-dehydrorhamnose 3,5-epimerase
MKVTRTEIPDVIVIEPKVFSDARGHFVETYNRRSFHQATGLDLEFVQDNQSVSKRHVLRGLHYQIRQPQGKLVRAIVGEVYDVVVDIRRRSPSFGKWTAVTLSAARNNLLWVPAGFAHGFLVLSETAVVQYKVTDYWAPEHERCIAWNDRQLGISWPIQGDPIVNDKDARGASLKSADLFD